MNKQSTDTGLSYSVTGGWNGRGECRFSARWEVRNSPYCGVY